MLDSSNKLEKSTMLFTLEKVGLCGQNLKKKKKRINFLLFLTLPPWYCIKDTCGMPINLVNTHIIFLLLEVTEWLKPRWILIWIQFFYLIPLLSREYGKLRKSSHLEDKKKKKNCGWVEVVAMKLCLNFQQLEGLWSTTSYFILLHRWEKNVLCAETSCFMKFSIVSHFSSWTTLI